MLDAVGTMGEGMVVDGGGRWSKREGGREKGGKNAYVPSLRWTRQFTHAYQHPGTLTDSIVEIQIRVFDYIFSNFKTRVKRTVS